MTHRKLTRCFNKLRLEDLRFQILETQDAHVISAQRHAAAAVAEAGRSGYTMSSATMSLARIATGGRNMQNADRDFEVHARRYCDLIPELSPFEFDMPFKKNAMVALRSGRLVACCRMRCSRACIVSDQMSLSEYLVRTTNAGVSGLMLKTNYGWHRILFVRLFLASLNLWCRFLFMETTSSARGDCRPCRLSSCLWHPQPLRAYLTLCFAYSVSSLSCCFLNP